MNNSLNQLRITNYELRKLKTKLRIIPACPVGRNYELRFF